MFEVDDVVRVGARTGVGENKPGGVGRVIHVSADGVDVKYVLGGRERCVPLEYVERYDGEQRSKRTVHGRCRRCGSLVVDCLHAQPDDDGEDDDTRRRALAERRKVARSWRRAMVGQRAAVVADEDDVVGDLSSSSSSSSDDESDDVTQPLDVGEDDMPATQPVEEDDSMPETQPMDSDDNSLAAEDEKDTFIVAEDDGDSMPADLAGLAPSKRATTRSLRRRMERVQRFVGTRGLRHARHEVAALRVRANSVSGRVALRDLERAASNVRAFVLRGLRRRGVDVADACYRQLASKGARAGLDAAARKQDLLDDALREVETDLEAIVELARGRCDRVRGRDDEGDEEGKVVAEDNAEKDDDDAKLSDIWGWEINLSEEKGMSVGSERRRRPPRRKRGVNDDPAAAPPFNRRTRSRVDAMTLQRQSHAPRRTLDTTPRRVRFTQEVEPTFSSLPPRKVVSDAATTNNQRRRRRRVSMISASRLAALYGPHRAIRFGKWLAVERGRDDDAEAASLLRRLVDDGAAGVEGARFEDSARSCRRDALELLRTCKLTRVEWTSLVPATLVASIDSAERAAGHRAEDLVQIDKLRLWLLGRAADETSDLVIRAALASCLVSMSLRGRASEDEEPVTVRAWRAAAPTTEMWRAIESNCLSGVDLVDRFRIATCVARALSAEPSCGDPRASWALIPNGEDFHSVGITSACRLATAMCAAGAGANNEMLWRLWDAAVGELGATASSSQSVQEESTHWWAEAVGRRVISTRLVLVAASSRYFNAQHGSPSLVRAATETVVCFAFSQPPGMHRKRVTLELIRRRALKAVSEHSEARLLVLSCLVSLAHAGLVDVDAGLVRTASTATAMNKDEDAALVASVLAKLAFTDDTKRAASAWLSDLEASLRHTKRAT